MSGDGSSLRSSFSTFSPNEGLAVIISLGKANDKGHTSVVYCLEVVGDLQNREFRILGKPFRLYNQHGRYIWCNQQLREERLTVGSIISYMRTSKSSKYCGNTAVEMDINKVISQLQFGEQNYGAVAYHGIEEAFPKAVVADPPDRGIRQRSGADSFRAEFALVSMKSAYIIDERIVFMTQLNEECSLKINCRAYKQSSIDMVVLPVRAPSSEEDVGDVVLIKLEGSSGSQAVCEGVLIKTSEQLGSYNIYSNPRGKCVIINNSFFHDGKSNRGGAEHDERALVTLFKDLCFTVDVRKDLERKEMQSVAEEYSKMDHSQFDAFVMIIMSHGDEGDVVYGVDGRTVRIEDLTSEFKALTCPTLQSKPKLFFIQACRGPLTEPKSHRQGTVPERASSSNNMCVDRCSMSAADSSLPRGTCPKETDFLLAFAASPGYESYRMSDVGSVFIQALVNVIRSRHNTHHLLDMLTEVIRVVVDQGSAEGMLLQVPAPSYTLRHQLWLKDL